MYERVKDSADKMMMATGVEVGECTGLTVISCLSAIQNFNPFRLAAAYALCSPPSPASGDGSYDDRAFSAALRFKSLRTYATNNGIGSETARFSDDKAYSRSERSGSGRHKVTLWRPENAVYNKKDGADCVNTEARLRLNKFR